ncbi:MAG TPA: hypothetical protein VFX61_03740 [Micromonosporaceae bacterium]|nr:hypothetical protein [Micromonosporaceae bacterium]
MRVTLLVDVGCSSSAGGPDVRTITEATEMQELLNLGVDGIMSDHVDVPTPIFVAARGTPAEYACP